MSIKELIKESNYETLKKMYELDNIEEYREWYINEYGKSVSIGMFLNDNMENFREWVLNLNDIKIQQKKIDAVKEVGIRVGGEELIHELEMHNIINC